MDFSGKAAVVTGASGGLGREIAVALGAAGARVGLVARSQQGLDETRRLIGQPETQVFCTDLRDGNGASGKDLDPNPSQVSPGPGQGFIPGRKGQNP